MYVTCPYCGYNDHVSEFDYDGVVTFTCPKCKGHFRVKVKERERRSE